MRIGIFGYGSIGKRHFANLVEMGETDLRVCDTMPGIHPHSPVALKFVSQVELWAWNPEAVIVCTPPSEHFDLVAEAIARHCHVFCEKPLTTCAADAALLVEKARKHEKVLAVGYQLLACPSVQSFSRDWKHLHIWDRQNIKSWPTASYQRDILQEYSHELSLAIFWAGSYPETARAEWLSHAVCVVHLTWADGRTAFIELQAGAVDYERGAQSDRGAWTFSQQENDIAYREELRAFLSDKPHCTGDTGFEVVRLMEHLC